MIGERVESLACSKCDTVMDVSSSEPFSIVECPNCGAQLSVPKRLGEFILMRFLGQGGMGAVFQAYDAKLGRQVAIKVLGSVLGSDTAAMDNFLREARAAAQITSPNVVSIYQVGEDNGVPFIVMELISGGQLDKMIEDKPLPELQALEVCRHAARGLSAAQEIGLFHGDIKPENILFDQHGIAKIADFGLAQFLQRGTRSKPGEIWGTPYYIAPEKARKQQEDYRSDIYSLGATLFHALTGQPPFEGETAAEVVLARLRQLPPDIRDIDPNLHAETEELVARMLDPDPTSRYPNYTSLLSDFDRVIDTIRHDRPAAGKGRSKGRKFLLFILLVLIGAGIAAPFLMEDGPTVFSQEQDDALTSRVHRWAKNRYRYDKATLHSFHETLTAYRRGLPADHDGTLWIEVVQGTVEALGMQTNEMRATFETLAARKEPQMIDGALNPAYMPVETARFFAGTSETYVVDTRIYPVWYKNLSSYFIAVKYLQAGQYKQARRHLQEYLQASRPEDAPAWPYSFLPIATTLNDSIRKWEARQDLLDRFLERGNTDKVIEKLDSYEVGTPPIFMRYITRNREKINAPPSSASEDGAPADLVDREKELREQEAEIRKRREEEAREKLKQQQEEEERRLAEEKQRAEREAAERAAKAVEQDMKLFREGANGVRILIGRRQFPQAIKAAAAVKKELATGEGLQQATLLQSACDLMASLDAFVVRNIGTVELPAAITRKLGGTPERATSEDIIIRITHGETSRPWDKVGNPLYIKLAEALIEGTRKTDTTQAELYQALAVFSRSIGAPPSWVEHYTEKAVTKNGDIRSELDQYVGLFPSRD